MRAASVSLGAMCLVFAGACAEGSSDDADASAAGSGSGSNAGGAGVAGAAGMAGLAGSGGNGGSAGAPPCPVDRATFSAEDVDQSLGGLNADLPEPSVDCRTEAEGDYMCIALSAMVAGMAREILCVAPGISLTDGTAINCNTSAQEDMTLSTRNFGGMRAPNTFTLTQTGPASNGLLDLVLAEGTFNSDDANFVEARAAGWVNRWEDRTYCRSSSWGTIAATWAGGDAGSGELLDASELGALDETLAEGSPMDAALGTRTVVILPAENARSSGSRTRVT